MNKDKIRLIIQLLLYVGLATFAALPVLAQVPVDENGNPIAPLVEGAAVEEFDDEEVPLLDVVELEDIVGPVALYPDDLLAIVLPASTYPLQIVQAARFLERLEADPSLTPDEEWDESITALLNYPEVVELMNEDIDWTWRLGEAVVAQQADVIAAIEAFRDKAYAAGNLKTDDRQTVTNEDGVIEIEPADEDVIYVPYYEPERVVVYQPRPVYHYYPHPYPVYYYPYPYGYSFYSGYFWGVTTAFTIGWLTDHLHVYHHSYWGHPYYGRHYHSHHYYRRPTLSHYNHYYVHNSHSYWNYRYRDGDYWRPRRHGGARPGHNVQRVHYYRDRNRDDWRHRGNDRTDDSGRFVSGVTGDRQARIRDRGNPADRRARDSSASSDRKGISFRSRETRARANRESSRDSSSVNRASFAPSSRRTTTAANSRRTAQARSGNERSRSRTVNNPRREVQTAPPRRASAASSHRAPSRSQPQRNAPTRAATPSRSQPQRSAPPRAAAPPSAPQRNAGSNSRSESRSSGSSSHGPSNRGERSSRRRN